MWPVHRMTSVQLWSYELKPFHQQCKPMEQESDSWKLHPYAKIWPELIYWSSLWLHPLWPMAMALEPVALSFLPRSSYNILPTLANHNHVIQCLEPMSRQKEGSKMYFLSIKYLKKGSKFYIFLQHLAKGRSTFYILHGLIHRVHPLTSVLVQTIARRMYGAKPSSRPLLAYWCSSQWNWKPGIIIFIQVNEFQKMPSVKWRPLVLGLHVLTHWGRDKMAAISQTTFSNAFSWMKMSKFRLKFHWILFLRV